jgi:hypothetical protein
MTEPAAETWTPTKPEGDDFTVATPPASSDGETKIYGEPTERGSTLEDINAIIERMADGQKEVLRESQPAPLSSEPSSNEHPEVPRFEPIPSSPNGPTVSGQPQEAAPRAMNAPYGTPGGAPGSVSGGVPQYGPERAPKGGDHQAPVGRAWESVPEVATALEPPAKEVESEANGLKRDPNTHIPTGKDVTSELSLEKIRRDLEALNDEGEENR